MTGTNTGVSLDAKLSLNRAKLDELRRAHGISNETELARRIGVTPSTLYRISMGQVQPSSSFVARVKIAFPMASLDSLFTVERGTDTRDLQAVAS